MSENAIEQSPAVELRIPYPRRAAIGGFILTTILLAFVGSFVLLAIRHLLHPHQTEWVALGSSVLWLALVVMVLVGICYYMGGAWAWLVSVLGLFSTNQFARIETLASSGERILSLGFRFAGMNFYYRKIALSGITGVNWNGGQASHQLQQELDDWSVAVWYDPSAVRWRLTPDHRLRREKALDLLGAPGSKASAEELGFELVELLRSAGVSLIAGEERMKFVRAPSA